MLLSGREGGSSLEVVGEFQSENMIEKENDENVRTRAAPPEQHFAP